VHYLGRAARYDRGSPINFLRRVRLPGAPLLEPASRGRRRLQPFEGGFDPHSALQRFFL